MRYGFVIPGGDVHEVVLFAHEAEAAGWDGVFIPDCIYIKGEDGLGFDPWVALAAMATQTGRVRLGTMITPLSRRRPWKVARETVTLDQLSNGRLTLPVGLGALDDVGFGGVGEATDRKARAELLDESLAILAGLWSGQPFSYTGKHYQLDEMTFASTPVQQPRIPVWVVGAWPRRKSMQRTLRWDGLLPNKLNDNGEQAELTPDDIREMRDFIATERTATTTFDIIYEGETPGEKPDEAVAIVRPWLEAGATWWMESMWSPRREREGASDATRWVLSRIRQGPPRE